ncbi:permease prefix domain 1-containing protein [Neobacillus niacini]|uniref:permease prefix domain 1-containing protein n=1 Tax=Neobacillus niacini TaxID=86668 RepID=UPI0021CB4CFA|nr:permease prefix domain 1-containing protein [Neobacillus niacini]MCM3767616.1 permease prefix domain 1-containing protein [Neobacillus niacini]
MKKLEQYIEKIVADLPMSDEERSDFQEELSIHLEEHVRELMIKGVPEDDAIRQAIKAFGHVDKINWEMKKAIFPFYKIVRFLWNVVFVTAFLCLISYSIMEFYHPEFSNTLPLESVLGGFFIVFFIAGAIEAIYEALMDQYRWRWLSNPWVVFLPPALMIAGIQTLTLIKNPDQYQEGFWIDLYAIPLATVLYLIARQLFTFIFPRQKQHLNRKKTV